MKVRFVHTLLLLATTVPCLAATGPDLSVAPVERVHRETINSPERTFVIHSRGDTPPVLERIVITGPAEDIRLKAVGGLDLSSIDSLAACLVRPGMTDEEKAKACFYFVGSNFYDRGGSGCEDPLEYVNLWGHSWCGNFALFLHALWEAAGLEALFLNPVIGMPGGHTISAVYYDNQWHMFDSRMRGYFLNRDNRTIASLVELGRDPELIRRGLDYNALGMGRWPYTTVMQNYSNSASDWYDGYNAHFDEKTLFHAHTPPWDGTLDLRRGETVTLDRGNSGKWWNRKDLSPEWLKLHNIETSNAVGVEPMIYSNGTLVFDIDPSLHGEQALESSGITVAGAGDSKAFAPERAGTEATVVYRVRGPYFVPSMSISAAGYRAGPGDRLAVEISTDEGRTWLPLWEAAGEGGLEIAASTDQTQRVTTYSENKYGYLVRFRMTAARNPGDASISRIRLTTDLYYRPMHLPTLDSGETRMVYRDSSPGSHERTVSVHWTEQSNILFSADDPCEGDRMTVSCRVANTGGSPARNVVVRFFDGEPGTWGRQIGEDVHIDLIEPGGSAVARTEWTARKRNRHGESVNVNRRWMSPPGYTHNTIHAVVDPDNGLAESDETDNRASRELVVNGMANLVLHHPSFIELERASAGRVRITALVRNMNMEGPRPRARAARDVVVRFYDEQPVHGQMERHMIAETTIPEIPPGEWGIARVDWDVSGMKGRKKIYVVVDPEDEIPESWQGRKGEYMFVTKDIDL